MTREEAYNRIDAIIARHEIDDDYVTITSVIDYDALRMARELLEQEPCEDVISRDAVWDVMQELWGTSGELLDRLMALPSVKPQNPKLGHCKDCKYFEYDSVAKVDGIPLIVAHEICSKWGDGCKTKEDGYCFLFEPQESEDKE